jgi:protein SCO1
VFAKSQSLLAKEGQKYHMISISIDPENDTPKKLAEYAKKFKATANWDFYTSSIETSVAIQKAFEVYRGDKMNHSSVVLLRSAPGKPWLRLEGFFSPQTVSEAFLAKVSPAKPK